MLLKRYVDLMVFLVEFATAVDLRTACEVDPVLLQVLEPSTVPQNPLEQRQVHRGLRFGEDVSDNIAEIGLTQHGLNNVHD